MKRLEMSGGEALHEKLADLLKKVGKANSVKIGFMDGSTYPDGTPVAMVAAIQNFGAPAVGIPARPFFSNMVREKSPNWGHNLGEALKIKDNDVAEALALMGMHIGSQLVQSIKDTNEPALSPITLMLRKMRSEDQSLVVTGKTVGEAAARVAAGESYSGTNTKALNDTAKMQNSIWFEVGDVGQVHVPAEGKK